MKYIQTLTEKGKLKWQDSDAPDANGRFRDLSPKDLAAWLIKTRKGDMKKISGSLSQQVAFNKNDDPEYAKKMDKTRKEVYKQLDREDLLDKIDESLQEPLYNSFFLLEFQKWVYKNRAKINRMSKDEKIKYLEDNYIKKYGKTHLGSEDLKGVGSDIYHSMVLDNIIKESVDMYYLDNAKEQLSNPHTILDITYDKTRRGDKFVRFDYENKYVPGKMLDTGPHFVKVFYDNNRDLKKISKELGMDLKESVLNEEDTWNDYPAAAKKNAQKAIDWKEKYGRDEVDAGTPVGWARAHQLAKGENLSTDTVKRMSAFNRHRKNSSIKPELKETPWKDRGYVAWLIWGGDEGVDWAIEKSKEIDAMKESKQMKYIKPLNEAEKYITDEFKVGDKIKTNFGEWEVIETDYAPNKSFIAPFIFKGKDMERVNIPNPPKTNKKAVGYKVTDGDKYPIIGFLYQYKDITKLATVGVDESVTEAKMPKKYIGNDEIVYLKTKEDSRGADYNLYYKGHDIDAGGHRFGSEKELEDFAANYILSNQLYKKLRYEDSIPLPESIEEAKLSKIHNAAKKGSYPVSLVVIENGKVIKQELVGTPQIVPAAFNQLKKEYPNATVHVEDRTGKRLFSESVTEGMSKSAIKKAIKVIDQQIEDEEGGDGEPLDNETLQALEQERERLLGMNERKYIKTLNEGYWSHYEYDKWTKENGKPKYPKWVKATLKELVQKGFMEPVYDAEHNYMVLWLSSIENKRRSELYAYDKKGKKEFGKVGYAMYQRFYNDLTGYNMFFMQGAMAALEVSKNIEDRIANGEFVEPAYYMMKEYFNSFGMDTKRSRVFNAAVKKLEAWMQDNKIDSMEYMNR